MCTLGPFSDFTGRELYWCTFEGRNGTGKTTLLNRIVQELRTLLPPHLEPQVLPKVSSSGIGELISKGLSDQGLFLSLGYEYPTALADSLLIASDRFLTIEQFISNANPTSVLVGDRGPDSIVAIHTAAISNAYPNLSKEDIFEWLFNLFATLPKPRRTFLLRAPINIIRTRIELRKGTRCVPALTADQIRFLEEVDELFLRLMDRQKERYEILDSREPLLFLQERVLNVILSDLKALNIT